MAETTTKLKTTTTTTTTKKKAPTYILFITLLLLFSFVSIYEQHKLLLLKIHHTRPTTSSNNDSNHHHDQVSSTAITSSSKRIIDSNHHDHDNEMQFGDAKGSAKIILKAAQIQRPIYDDIIDHDVERARCARYKLDYTLPSSSQHSNNSTSSSSNFTTTTNKNNNTQRNKQRRRIFWGAMIADDSWHTIATQAMETYGIFHTVAFVESNRTQMANARKLRFGEGSANKRILTEGGMFGVDTSVTVDYYINEDTTKLVGLEREHAQRSLILHRWKLAGMTKDDIGYLSDVDELFTRDFLRAMQLCDVPQFTSDGKEGKDGHNNCVAPKVYGLVAIFEGSPMCVSSEEIYHPALMIGECIEGIGDGALHPKPSRYESVSTNWRTDNYTFKTYYQALHDPQNLPLPKHLPSNAYFPLWNAADFRRCSGGYFYGDDTLPLYVGWHVHNFFDDDLGVMRKKYLTYGHPISDALTRPLSDMNREVNLMVRCSKNDGTYELERGSVTKMYKSMEDRRKGPIALRKGGLDFLREANFGVDITGGAVPLAFRMEEYVVARHGELVASVEKDERERLQAIANIRHYHPPLP